MRLAILTFAAAACLSACVSNVTSYTYDNAKVGDLEIRVVGSPAGASFDLVGASPAASKINAFTRHWREEQAASARECRENGDPGWQSALTAKQVIGRYLIVTDEMGINVCGGALDNSHLYTQVFDLDSGDKVDTCSWLADDCKGLDNYGAPNSLLGEMIKEQASSALECKIFSIDYGVQGPYPTADGLVFATFHELRTCNVDVTFTYDAIAPLLSQEGRKVVAGLRGQR